jgi:hypothetical protein
MLKRQKRFSKDLKNTHKRNAIIIGIGLLIVIGVTVWTVYRFLELIS